MDRGTASIIHMCIATVCLRMGHLFYSWFDKTKLEKKSMKYVYVAGGGGDDDSEAIGALSVEVPGM